MAIKKKQYQAELTLYQETLERAERKYKRQLRKDPTVTPEDFGLSSSMFEELRPDTKSGRVSIKQIRQKTSALEEYTNRQYGLKKIGTTIEGGQVKNVYMPKNEYKLALEQLKAENRYRETLSRAIDKAGGYEYARLTKGGIVKEKSNFYNASITKSNDLIPVRINIVGGKTIGYKGNLVSREITLSPENFKRRYGTFTSRATSTNDIKTKNLMNNWLEGLENNVSKSFRNEIENTLRELDIDTTDFLGLFYLSSAFDFDFIYDEAIAIESKKEEIKSELEAFKQDKKSYRAFRKEMEKVSE